MEKYDLEILTDDWTRYDANSAIVRTSSLSPEEIERFVKAFEAEIERVWESMVRDYREKTIQPEMILQVEGHFRMKLVYRLLAEDLIEKVGGFRPAGDRRRERKRSLRSCACGLKGPRGSTGS